MALVGIVATSLSFYIEPFFVCCRDSDDYSVLNILIKPVSALLGIVAISILLYQTSVSLFARDSGDHSVLLYKSYLTLLGIVVTALSFYMKGIYLPPIT